MLELIAGAKRQTWRGRITRAMDRCRVLSRWERAGRAFFWACVGFSIAIALVIEARRSMPVPPVELLDPEIEHAAEQYTVYRLRMQWRETEKSCEPVIYRDRLTWRLTCEPR